MIVSFDKSFLFVHVPKTGGTSIRAVVSPYAHRPETQWLNRALSGVGIPVNYYLGHYRDYRFRTHEPIRRALRIFPPELIERTFKFAFVRNPWDLLTSYRQFICATPGHKRYRRVSKLSFPDYLRFAIDKRMGWQKPLLTDDQGRIRVDFVGRFENLQHDFVFIAQQLNIPGRLPHANRGTARDYRECYTRRTRQLVQDAYADDIDTFGYEFEGTSQRAAPRQAA
jgi:hypothetical protein